MIEKDPGYILLTGTSNVPLAESIAKYLKKELFQPISVFADGEIRVKGIPNLRRRHVFIIQPFSTPVNDKIMELILMIDAAKRASAKEVIAIVPYFGYSRQDRKEQPRVPISASVVAQMIEHAGADRILTIDIHSEQEEGFVKIPWDNLYGSYMIFPAIKAKKLKNVVVASPDKGGMIRATAYASRLHAEGVAVVYKQRDINMNNVSKALGMIGHIKDKNVVLVDDMIDTGGTIVQAADFLKKKGAKKVFVATTHGLFNGNAVEKINTSSIDEVIVTDSVLLKEKAKKSPKIQVVTVAPLLAEAIKRIRSGESLSTNFIFSS